MSQKENAQAVQSEGADKKTEQGQRSRFGTKSKRELMRRLQRGEIMKVLRDRYRDHGYQIPDDEAGYGDLWALMDNTARAPVSPEERMRNDLEIWAPWLIDAGKAEDYIRHMMSLASYELGQDGQREIGRRLGVDRELWERLGLKQIKPWDMSDEEIAEYRRAKRNERRRSRYIRSRFDYLADSLTVSKPWEAEGISRRTWERRRRRDATHRSSAQSMGAHDLPFPSHVDSTTLPAPLPPGSHDGDAGPVASIRVYPDRTCDMSSEQKDGSCDSLDPKLAAMERWGANAQRKRPNV